MKSEEGGTGGASPPLCVLSDLGERKSLRSRVKREEGRGKREEREGGLSTFGFFVHFVVNPSWRFLAILARGSRFAPEERVKSEEGGAGGASPPLCVLSDLGERRFLRNFRSR